VRFCELTGCGHYLHHDDPLAFLRGVRDALDAPSWPAMRVRQAAPVPRIRAEPVPQFAFPFAAKTTV
jgi:hypothetical protein